MVNLNPFRKLAPGVETPFPGVVIPFGRPDRKKAATPIDLAAVIEAEIIPRLLLACDSEDRLEPQREARMAARRAGVAAFARRTLEEDRETLLAEVLKRLDDGASFADLCLDLLSPSARLLGEWWEEDRVTFAEVTIGLCRLQQIVYEVGDRCDQVGPRPDAPRVLFALAPGDQHMFGLVMAAELFRCAGWRTVLAVDAGADDLAEMVAAQTFDLIAFSVVDEQWLPVLPELIARLREASRRPDIQVLVGGRVFDADPGRVEACGADCYAVDPASALTLAGQALARLLPVA